MKKWIKRGKGETSPPNLPFTEKVEWVRKEKLNQIHHTLKRKPNLDLTKPPGYLKRGKMGTGVPANQRCLKEKENHD